MDKLAVSVAEAAAASGLGRTFLYERIQRGELLSIRAGARRLILTSDLLAYLESLRVPNPNEQNKDGAVLTLGRKHTTPSDREVPCADTTRR